VSNELRDPQDVTVRSTDDLSYPGIPDAGSKAAWIFNAYAPWVHAYGQNSDANALQVAMWESLYDADGNLSSGVFQMLGAEDPTVRPKAEAFLASLFWEDGQPNHSRATWLDTPAGQGQDQMVPIPEPYSECRRRWL
jgi:hypothetical protein